MRVYIVDLEPVESRYTKQWKDLLPLMMEHAGINVYSVSGPALPQVTTPGAFLNFAGTNSYKASQIQWIAELFQQTDNELCPKDGDYFLYTDAWNPTVIQLKYMIELLGKKIRIGGLWHAGSYDPQDFLGRLIGDKPWVRNAESSMFHCYDDNFFATRFHANMFLKELFDVKVLFEDDELAQWELEKYPHNPNIHIVGWPMEYLPQILKPYENIEKKDKIIFPHRLAPEKQLDIFKDLAATMPEYEWFVAQEHKLNKDQYHTHLAESKIAFSANLQETLGISMYEAALVGTWPMVPRRLSYDEMWPECYPNEWTRDWDSYIANKDKVVEYIRNYMKDDGMLPIVAQTRAKQVGEKFFDGSALYKAIIDNAS